MRHSDNDILTCEETELLLEDYLEGYLLESQRESLEAHLAGCPVCRGELMALRNLEARLGDQREIDVPPGLERRIVDRLPRRRFPPWVRRTMTAGGLGIGAAVVMTVLGLLALTTPRDGRGGKSVEIVFHDPDARNVAVAGDFNDWDTNLTRMRRDRDGVWRITLELRPGFYQYNFFIDGRHWADANTVGGPSINDGFGGSNAVLYVEG